MGRARVGQEEQDEAESDDVEVVVLDAYELFQPEAMGAERTQEDHSEAQHVNRGPHLAFTPVEHVRA